MQPLALVHSSHQTIPSETDGKIMTTEATASKRAKYAQNVSDDYISTGIVEISINRKRKAVSISEGRLASLDNMTFMELRT